jgi:hypothetical protein
VKTGSYRGESQERSWMGLPKRHDIMLTSGAKTLEALTKRVSKLLDPEPQLQDYFSSEEFRKRLLVSPVFATTAFLDFISPILVLASPGDASAVMSKWDKCAHDLEDATAEILDVLVQR